MPMLVCATWRVRSAAILRDPSGRGTVAVHAGGSLGKLAQANGTTAADLLKANPDIVDPNRDRAGSVLNLPPSAGGPVPEPDDADAADADAQGSPDADREQDDSLRNASKGADHADASSPDAAKMKAALMPSEKDGERDELLFKSADQLTEAEALDLGRWYHALQSSGPLRSALEKRRRDFYVHNYGNDPAAHDETGRMKPVQPIRRLRRLNPSPSRRRGPKPLAVLDSRLRGNDN